MSKSNNKSLLPSLIRRMLKIVLYNNKKCEEFKLISSRETQVLWRNGLKKVLMIGNKTWIKSVREKLNSLSLTLLKPKNIIKLL